MLLVDPVMGDDGRTYGIYSAALLDGMKALSRKADVITPNLTEACLLADYDIEKVYSDTRKDVLLPLATEISEKLRDLSGKIRMSSSPVSNAEMISLPLSTIS